MARLVPILLLGCLAIGTCNELRSQDIIVRIYGDTIHCKVDERNERFVYYRTPDTQRGEQQVISQKEIREIIYNAYSESDIKPWSEDLKNKRFEIAVDGGYSRLLDPHSLFEDDLEDFYNKLANGYYVHGSVLYNINQNLGLGASYARSEYTTDAVPIQLIVPGNVTLTGVISDRRTIDYYAANLTYRLVDMGMTDRFAISLGVGLLRYSGAAELIYPYRLSANAFGIHLIGSYELSLGGGVYLPIRLGVRGFSVFDIGMDAPPEMPEVIDEFLRMSFSGEGGFNLTRLDIGAGLLFSF